MLWRLSVRALAGLLAAALAYLSFTMVQVWWTSYRDQRQPAEAIVVMGAAQYNGRPLYCAAPMTTMASAG